jgi:tetraacyldisaccharide 4'-kinase
MNWQARRKRWMRSFWGRLLLWAASVAYGLGVGVRGLLYDAGVLRSRRIGAKVICIGNITTGGTGKTPATVLAAQTLRRRDQAVAILSRGYGRPEHTKEVCAITDHSHMSWRQCGDEPWMMHQILKGQDVPILVSPDRTRAGRQAVTFYECEVVILDDGFQHRKLKHDLDIVLINAMDPFGGCRLLPMGNLREPIRSLRRAHIIMLTHVDMAGEAELAALRKEVHRVNAKAPLLESVHRPDFMLDIKNEQKYKLDHLAGRPVATLCGIGAPEQFEAQVRQNASGLTQRWRYPDHHRYTHKEIASIAHLLGDIPLVTTFKDIVRFPADWRELFKGDVYVLSIKLDIVKGKSVWLDSLHALAEGKPAHPAAKAGHKHA